MLARIIKRLEKKANITELTLFFLIINTLLESFIFTLCSDYELKEFYYHTNTEQSCYNGL